MNRDIISRTPGGERMLAGAILLVFGAILFKATEFQLVFQIRIIFAAIGFFGFVQIARGLFAWKYMDRMEFLASRLHENLFIDVQLKNRELGLLHRIEDALIELIKNSKTIKIDVHSVDTANNMGTIHLSGKQADAMFAQIHSVLARFTLPNGLHIFPKQGQPIDTAINGKRVLMDIPNRELSL